MSSPSAATPFLLLFRNSGPETHAPLSPAERQQLVTRWNAWYDGLAASLDEATAIAQSHPGLAYGLIIEVRSLACHRVAKVRRISEAALRFESRSSFTGPAFVFSENCVSARHASVLIPLSETRDFYRKMSGHDFASQRLLFDPAPSASAICPSAP